jgi:hypothetical protein
VIYEGKQFRGNVHSADVVRFIECFTEASDRYFDTLAESLFGESRRPQGSSDNVQNLLQCAGRPATSSRCKSDTMKE